MNQPLQLDAGVSAQRPRDGIGGYGALGDAAPERSIVTFSANGARRPMGHEAATRTEIARRLAGLMGFEFAGEHAPNVVWTTQP